MKTRPLKQVAVWHNVDKATFTQAVPLYLMISPLASDVKVTSLNCDLM